MAARQVTKKEQIISLASQDPFLKIADIAVTVGTTSRYVRTILSEARISLSELRHAYARRIEKRLQADNPLRPDVRSEALISGLMCAQSPCVMQITDTRAADILGKPQTEPLLCVSRLKSVDGKPFYLSHLFTANRLVISDGLSHCDQPLLRLLGVSDADRVKQKLISLEVVKADTILAKSLGLLEGSPVLRSVSVLSVNEQRLAVEYSYCNAYLVRLEIGGFTDQSLKIIEKVDE